MKNHKLILIIVAFALCFALATNSWESVNAKNKITTITKNLVYQKPLDISLGRGGVYFPSSFYTGTAELKRIEPVHTKKLTFTQRWIDIKLYNTSGKSITTPRGFAYVYFVLNVEDRDAWNKDKLGIYQYNEAKKIWEETSARLITTDTNAPYGRLSLLIADRYGLYGLAIKR
jgi:hypothetical protein